MAKRNYIVLNTGDRYGRLTVVGLGKPANSGQKRWLLKCDCGNEINATGYDVIHGKYLSCGCYDNQLMAQRNFRHGKAHTRLYNVWCGMKQRCNDKKHISYSGYGGRGISVCKEWDESYTAFYDWSMQNGYDDAAKRGECTLDRIDNDADYSPDNCRWVSMKIQASNKRHGSP